MKKLELLLMLFSLSLLVGCSNGGTGGGGGGGGVSVSLTPNTNPTVVGVTLTQQFTANVTGTSNHSVTWSVSGSGCTGAACGSIDSNGLYTAPAAPPSPATVTVKATSAADSSKSASVTVKIVHISVTVLPPSTTVALNGTQQFTAQVSPPTSVTWTVTGTGCNGTTCGTVDANGLYTAPSSLPNPASVKVRATSTADAAGTDFATVTLVTSFNSRLNGTYAFRFSGFDGAGAVSSAGNFQADGSGTIVSGIQDVNRASGVQQSLPFTGTYSVGSDNRGTMTLITILGTAIYSFAISASGEIIFIEFDSSGTRGAGIIDKATTPFSAAQVSGPYVMNLLGSDSANKRIGLAGVFQANAGNLISGAADLNDNGVTSSSSSVSGTYTVGSNGRGTMNFVAPGAGTFNFNFSFYVVNKDKLYFVSTDPAGSDRLGGLVLSQDTTTSFSNASFTGHTVFSLTGEESSLSNVAAVGILDPDGAGSMASSSMFDENNAGLIISQQTLSGTYTMGSNGRGTISLSGTAPAASFAVYAITKNKAFLLDTASTAVLSGFLEPQAANLGPSTIQGVFVTGSVPAASNIAGVSTLDGVNSFTGIQDRSTPSANIAGEAVAGSYSVASNGRGTMTLTSPATTNRVFYIINNSEFKAIGVDNGDLESTLVVSQR